MMHATELNANSLEEIASTMPHGHVAFCDDSEVGDADGMKPDVGLLVAIELQPSAYAMARARLGSHLSDGLPQEFHATDIVGGRKGTPWGSVSFQRRLEAFREISESLVATGAMLSYVHITETQYGEMRRDLADRNLDPQLSWRSAMRRVFLRTLIDEAARRDAPTLIVTDQYRPIAGPTLDRSERAPGLVGGGVLMAPSDQIIGLQLADMAAFCVGRHLRRRSRYDPDALQGFDRLVVETIAGFHGRSRSLLSPLPN